MQAVHQPLAFVQAAHRNVNVAKVDNVAQVGQAKKKAACLLASGRR
jgi:hypothetical protein